MLSRETTTVPIKDYSLPQSPLMDRAMREDAQSRASQMELRGKMHTQLLNSVGAGAPADKSMATSNLAVAGYHRAPGERMSDPESEREYAESLVERLPANLRESFRARSTSLLPR